MRQTPIFPPSNTLPALHTGTEQGDLDGWLAGNGTGMKSRRVRWAMYSRRWTPALLLMVLCAMQSTASNAEQPRIGVAASTRPNAEAIIGANSQTLSAGSELYTNETVRTGNRGAADLVFIDNSNLSVGPSSEVLLDQFVYDPIGSSGIVVSQATRGKFRIATGSQDHRVNTPYGTLGLLGTHKLGEIRSRCRRCARLCAARRARSCAG